jgi:hypothetical protein
MIEVTLSHINLLLTIGAFNSLLANILKEYYDIEWVFFHVLILILYCIFLNIFFENATLP